MNNMLMQNDMNNAHLDYGEAEDDEIDNKLRELQRQMSILQAQREEKIKRRRLSAPHNGVAQVPQASHGWGQHQFATQSGAPPQAVFQQNQIPDGYQYSNQSGSGSGI